MRTFARLLALIVLVLAAFPLAILTRWLILGALPPEVAATPQGVLVGTMVAVMIASWLVYLLGRPLVSSHGASTKPLETRPLSSPPLSSPPLSSPPLSSRPLSSPPLPNAARPPARVPFFPNTGHLSLDRLCQDEQTRNNIALLREQEAQRHRHGKPDRAVPEDTEPGA